MIVVPQDDGTFTAHCDRCPQTFNLAGEEMLGVMASQHDSRHAEEDRLVTSLERAGQLTPRTMRDLHVHNGSCTDASCPGNGFVTRADLVAMSKARRQ